MQAQDITFTVILDDMTPARYQEIMRMVKKVGTGDIETYTYDPESTPVEEVDNPLFHPDIDTPLNA